MGFTLGSVFAHFHQTRRFASGMFFANFRNKRNNGCFRRMGLSVKIFCCGHDNVDHIWKTATATPALVHLVINARRGDECPRVFVEKSTDCLFNFLSRDQITAANQHGVTFVNAAQITINGYIMMF